MVKELTLIGLFAALYLLFPLATLGQDTSQRAVAREPVSLIPANANRLDTRRTGRAVPVRPARRSEPRRVDRSASATSPAASEDGPFDRSASSGAENSDGYTTLSRAAGGASITAQTEPATSTANPASRAETETVRSLQTKLNTLGYDAGTVDGLLGPRTRAAIDAFREAEGILPSITEPSVLLARADAVAEDRAAEPSPLPAERITVDFDERHPVHAAADSARPPAAASETDPSGGNRTDGLAAAPSSTTETSRLEDGRPLNAIDLIGRVMTNDQGMKLGEVRNVLFERDGKVAGLLVRVGGFHLLGDTFASIIGESGYEIAVPWSEVRIDWDGRVLVDMTWADLEERPTYDPDVATASTDL